MSQERIVCAANWYKELDLKRDDFPAGLMRPINCDEGIVFCGLRHQSCLYQMIAMTGLVQYQAGEEVQGFLTSKNRFVDRIEGMKIAHKSGQVDANKISRNWLDSSDLY